MRIKRIVAVVVLILVLVVSAVLAKKYFEPKPKYNLILISVDTLRPDHIGVYGHPKNATPNIDKWAKEAMIFTNAYTIFPKTFQSFYTLFTGRDDALNDDRLKYNYAVFGMNKPLSITLPQILRNNNLKTAAFFTNPVLNGPAAKIFEPGFDEFNFFEETNLWPQLNPYNAGRLFNEIFSHDYFNSGNLTEDAIAWLNKNSKNRFFLWVHYTNPHEPYNPPQTYACKLDKKFCDKKFYEESLQQTLPRCTEETLVNESTVKDLETLYDAEILAVDEQIGKILGALKAKGLEDNTIVVFYGDHGESFENGIYGHGYTLYNSEVKIPLIIKVPNGQRGKSDILLDNTAILPTVLDLLRIPLKKYAFTGSSFKKELTGNGKEWQKKNIFFQTPIDWTNKYGVTDGKYKYIYSNNTDCLTDNRTEELYDIKKDPQENHNLIDTNNNVAKPFKKMLSERIEQDSKTKKDIINSLKSLGY